MKFFADVAGFDEDRRHEALDVPWAGLHEDLDALSGTLVGRRSRKTDSAVYAEWRRFMDPATRQRYLV